MSDFSSDSNVVNDEDLNWCTNNFNHVDYIKNHVRILLSQKILFIKFNFIYSFFTVSIL